MSTEEPTPAPVEEQAKPADEAKAETKEAETEKKGLFQKVFCCFAEKEEEPKEEKKEEKEEEPAAEDKKEDDKPAEDK